MAAEHRDLTLGQIMPSKSSITAPFSHMGNSLSVFLLLGAVLLTVLAGLFMVIGAMLGTLVHATGLAAAPATLLAPAHVLMFLILVLLLILLVYSMRAGRTASAPYPTQFPEALVSIASALRGNSAALASIAGTDQAARAKAVDEARASLENAARALDALAAMLRAPSR